MCRVKSVLSSCVLALSLSPGVAMSAQDDLVSTFATCTGRLSALMEHQWLMDTSRADDTRDRRARMVDLLEAPGLGLDIDAEGAKKYLSEEDQGFFAP